MPIKSYVSFKLIERKPKTNVYEIMSESRGNILGRIFWYGPWRQYVFEPLPDTVWSRGCLKEITSFLDGLMEARKKKGGPYHARE